MLSRGAYGASARGQTYVRITTPNNLELALEGLVRKVLQEQPKQEDIYSFAADYFETLVEIRDKAELPDKKIEEICPNHSEFEAQSLIKLATSFPKPAFLAAASSAIATEELCRVVDIDEIKAGEENTVIDLTEVTKAEGTDGSSGSEQQELETEDVERTEIANVDNEGASEELNDDGNIDKLAEELDEKLELDDSINIEESRVEPEDVNDIDKAENHSEVVNFVNEPLSDEVVGEVGTVNNESEENEIGDEIKNAADSSVARETMANGELIENKPSDIIAEKSVINENETDLSNDEQVLPKEEDDEQKVKSTLEGDNDKETSPLPNNDNADTITPIMLESKSLEKAQDPSDAIIKSESTETNETIPADDGERDIIKEFIDKERDYCTMGNSTRSIEVAEIHEVGVEEGIPMEEEDVIQEVTAQELLVENSDLIGGASSDSSGTKIEDCLTKAATAGAIIGGITHVAANNMEEKVGKEELEETSESLLSVADKSKETEIVATTRKKRDTADQESSEVNNAVADSEIKVDGVNNEDKVGDKQEDILDFSTTTIDDQKTEKLTELETLEPETSATLELEELKSNIEDSVSSETQEINEVLVQKLDTEPNAQESAIVETDIGTETSGYVEKIEKVQNDEKGKPDNDTKNEVIENIINGTEGNKNVGEDKISSKDKTAEDEHENPRLPAEGGHIMGEEIMDDDFNKEPSLETIEEEKLDIIDSKVEIPKSSSESKDNEETLIGVIETNNEQNKNDDNERNEDDIEDVKNSEPQEEVQNKSDLTTSPVEESSASEEIEPTAPAIVEGTPDGQISQEAEAVVAEVLERATENAIKMESTNAEPANSEDSEIKEVQTDIESVPTEEPEIETKEVKAELETLPREIQAITIDKIGNDSENSRSRSSKDSESLGDENPFISAEVKTMVEAEASVEENEDPEDEEDKIVPLNAEINPIEEKDEGQWAAQMGLVRAALTIQKTFRAYLHRKRNSLKPESQPEEVLAENEVQEEVIKSQSSALNDSMSTDSSLSSSATKIQQSEHKDLKLARRNTAAENVTPHSFTEEDVKERTKSFSISHRVRDSEVWSTIEHELESAATTIQNSYKNYKNRQRLRREDAVQITTTASEDSVGSPKREGLQGTGELHDVIVPEEFEGK